MSLCQMKLQCDDWQENRENFPLHVIHMTEQNLCENLFSWKMVQVIDIVLTLSCFNFIFTGEWMLCNSKTLYGCIRTILIMLLICNCPVVLSVSHSLAFTTFDRSVHNSCFSVGCCSRFTTVHCVESCDGSCWWLQS